MLVRKQQLGEEESAGDRRDYCWRKNAWKVQKEGGSKAQVRAGPGGGRATRDGTGRDGTSGEAGRKPGGSPQVQGRCRQRAGLVLDVEFRLVSSACRYSHLLTVRRAVWVRLEERVKVEAGGVGSEMPRGPVGRLP